LSLLGEVKMFLDHLGHARPSRLAAGKTDL